jgi:hypothetical protein
MNKALRTRFPLPSNEKELRAAIQGICAEFGQLANIHILPASDLDGLQCTCFIRLDDSAAQSALRSRHHVLIFDSDLGFFADVAENWTGPRM